MLIDTSEYTTEDISYLRHGPESLLLRLYRPLGSGPFPLVVDLHGGAWTAGDFGDCEARDQVLVETGLAVAALNFRHGADGYPKSLIDINYAIRWLKAEAQAHRIDPARVGLSGQSSGGHLVMLAAMRPEESTVLPKEARSSKVSVPRCHFTGP